MKINVVLVMLLIALTGLAGAEEVPTPTEIQGGGIIGVEEAKRLLDQKDAIFFDVRNPINYGKGHIETAVSLPYKGKVVKSADFSPSLQSMNPSKFPSDKDINVVIYSHGATGWKSYLAAKLFIKSGFQNVLWFRDGYSEWKIKGYSINR
jgi:rhodanese-related sulfurtransferase